MLQTLAQAGPVHAGTGIEWMILASLVVPVLLLILIFWYGHKNTV
jgi:hypothetical protein